LSTKTDEKPAVTTTHVLLVIDMSGSMMNLAADVRGGFNAYKAQLAADSAGDYRLTVTVFDTEFVSLAVDTPLADTPDLTPSNYVPRGGTALNDAIGRTLAEFDLKHGNVKKHERVLVVINTDGHENSSREFTTDQIRALISEKDKSDRWAFIFLGAGPAAFAAGGSYGLGHSTIATNQTGAGTRSTYSGLAVASAGYSRGASVGETVSVLEGTDGLVDPDAK
jgi:uncharacterized protein YegL